MNCCRKTFRSAGNSLGLPALLLSLGVFFVDHANAQTIVPLDCEETVTGTFGTNPFEQKHIYSFQGDAGERLLISWAVTFPSKTHRLIVEVLDPQNQKLSFQGGITNPDDGINSDRTTLPVSGSYRLEVSNSFIRQNGVSYFLSLQSFSGGCAASLTCGGSVTGQITQVTQIDTVTFSGVAGQAVALRTEATSGPLQLRAYLIDEAGEFVGINFTQFDELKFVFPLEGNLRKPGKPLVLPSTGTYVVTIADNEDYDGASPNAHRPGDYEVSLTCDCTYSASPVTLSFPAGGGTSQVDVNVTDGCNWKVGGGSSFTSFSNNLLEIANILLWGWRSLGGSHRVRKLSNQSTDQHAATIGNLESRRHGYCRQSGRSAVRLHDLAAERGIPGRWRSRDDSSLYGTGVLVGHRSESAANYVRGSKHEARSTSAALHVGRESLSPAPDHSDHGCGTPLPH